MYGDYPDDQRSQPTLAQRGLSWPNVAQHWANIAVFTGYVDQNIILQ